MSDEIGYRKPPKRTQFRKGVSGNPKGRRKADRNNPGEIVRRVLAQTVCVTENGRRRRITKFEAAFTQLANQAIKGESRALKLFLPAAQHFSEKSSSDGAEPYIVEIVRFGDGPTEQGGK